MRAAGAHDDRRGRAAARRRGRDGRDHRPAGLMAVTRARRRGRRAPARRDASRGARRCCPRRTISERAGGTVALKAENLQRTGSFKVRGAAAKLAALGDEGCAHGVVAASRRQPRPGARRRGAPRAACACEVFVPADAPIAKVEAARGPGRDRPRRRRLASTSACVTAARARARAAGSPSCTRSTTRTIVAGQGSLGLELLEDVPGPRARSSSRSAAAGCARASRSRSSPRGRRSRSSACRSPPARRTPSRCGAASRCRPTSALTIADGIAVKRPGELTLRAADAAGSTTSSSWSRTRTPRRRWSLLLERCKLVVEGAGAVGVAALLGGQVAPAARGTTVAVLSGGNVDAGLLAVDRPPPRDRGRAAGSCCSRRVPDRPGRPRRACSRCVAGTGANIVDV